jgi:transposase-like protein
LDTFNLMSGEMSCPTCRQKEGERQSGYADTSEIHQVCQDLFSKFVVLESELADLSDRISREQRDWQPNGLFDRLQRSMAQDCRGLD